MKNLTVSFVLSVVAVFAARAVVLDKAYLVADRPAEGEAAISRSEALVFRSGGDRIYGQILAGCVALVPHHRGSLSIPYSGPADFRVTHTSSGVGDDRSLQLRRLSKGLR